MVGFGVAELLKRASSRIAAVADDEMSIFTQHIGETTGVIRHHLDDMVMLGRSEGPLWLPGWEDRKNGAPLWFRADAVSHHMLHDFNDRENGISFDAKPEDRERRSAWASARDMCGEREYEVIKEEDLIVEERDGKDTRYYVDRSKAKVVPTPWYDPDHPTVHIAVHAGADDFGLKLNGYDENGNAVERLIAVEGTSFGLLVAHTPGFQRLLADNPHSNVAFGPSCGPARYSATAGQRAVDAMVANGMDRRVFASTGGRLLAHAYDAEGTRVWDYQPETSTLAITEGKDKQGNLVPGEYVELRTPWFGS